MSKKDYENTPYRVGYNDYETVEEAQKEATRRALKDWENVPVFKVFGVAKFNLSKLNPDLVTYETLAQ